MHPKIKIKGIREGILIILGDGAWVELREALLEHLDEKGKFLSGAHLAVDVGNCVLDAPDILDLRNEISNRQLELRAVLSLSPVTEQNAQSLGLATKIGRMSPEVELSSIGTVLQEGGDAVLLRRTLRSGYSIKNAGHVIIIGDVNPGAEIMAGGDVLVWGKLRGVVHAGAGGNENAVVCALDLSPTQLRIAGFISLTPKRRGKPSPEMAHIKDGQVVAEPWDPKREKI